MIDAIDGKKWVKFVAMHHNSATLMYDVNTIKGTVESCLKKKLHSHSKQDSSKTEKSHLVLKSPKNRKLFLATLITHT